MLNLNFYVKNRFDLKLYSIPEEVEIPFDVDIPEGEVPFEWVADVVIRVSALQVEMEAEDIKLESRYEKDLNADSLDIVEINMKLEKMLGITVPDYCIAFIITVEDAVLIIHRIINNIELPKNWDPEKRKK